MDLWLPILELGSFIWNAGDWQKRRQEQRCMQAKVDSPMSMLPTSSRTLASEPRVVVFKYVIGIDTQIKRDEYLHDSHEKTHVSQTPKLEKAWPSSQTMPGPRNKSVLSNEDLFNPDLSPSIQR